MRARYQNGQNISHLSKGLLATATGKTSCSPRQNTNMLIMQPTLENKGCEYVDLVDYIDILEHKRCPYVDYVDQVDYVDYARTQKMLIC